MVTKIYLNYPLKRVPLNGFVRFNGIFFRRRTCNAGRIYLHCPIEYCPDLSVPSGILVEYYKES